MVFILKVYHGAISPLFGFGNCCRFSPSCSVYAVEALTKHGVLQGSKLVFLRLLKCHPWHEGGVDLVPEKNTKEFKFQ